MWYAVKTPAFAKLLFPGILWNYPPATPPKIYLTFDDGPIPAVTPWVLSQLRQYQAKATFFCIGQNVLAYPDVYTQLLAEGHAVGNHSFRHLNGWKLSTAAYMEDVAKCAELVDSKLFRPPYGRLRQSQRRALIKNQYRPILWDVMAGDFDTSISPEKCLQRILHFSKNGSIIVLHDNKKAWPNLEYVLPKVLEHYTASGFQFDCIK